MYLIDTDKDYIYSRRFDYSLDKLLQRYPDGVPPHIMAAVFLIKESDINAIFENIVNKLRLHMKVE